MTIKKQKYVDDFWVNELGSKKHVKILTCELTEDVCVASNCPFFKMTGTGVIKNSLGSCQFYDVDSIIEVKK